MIIQDIYNKQQKFFDSNKTKDVSFRIEQLKKLKVALEENEDLLLEAIYEDYGKSKFETFVTELSLLYHEINFTLKNIKKWSNRKKVKTGLVHFPAKSYCIPEPLGTTLVIGAWNYPYQLSLVPAVSSIAAGNTVILKPSKIAAHTSYAMQEIISKHFPSEYFCVVEGGVEETTELLKYRFDKIFFTGSTQVGKIVYQAAAKHLTPITLELGGKSPTFVLADTNIKMSAKRIVWAKFLNAGQTCLAPDYILVESAIKDDLIEAMKNEIRQYYKSDELGENYVRIINTKNFDRLKQLIEPDKVSIGGHTNREERFIAPTIMKDVSFDDAIMKDEIFGPILPVISFTDLDKTISKVKERPKPLSCYVYSKNRKTINKILKEISFGGGVINDSLMHFANNNLPFGGVGLSGIGSYHGKSGFDAFSHYKSILDKPFWFEPFIKYAPYSKHKLNIIRWLME